MPTSKTRTVSLPYVQGLIEYLNYKGIDMAAFLSDFALDTDAMKKEGHRIPLQTFTAMFESGEKLTGDVNIGLNVGTGIKTGHYGVLGYSVMSCTFFEEALHRHLRYQNLVADIGCTNLSSSQEESVLVWDTGAIPPSRHIAEHNLAGWITYARWICDLDSQPLWIAFQHERPDNSDAHLQLFNCPIKFNQDKTAIAFPSSYLKLPLPQKDPAIRDMMDKHAERLLSKQNEGEDFINAVQTYIKIALEEDKYDLEDVAQHFGMSPRTLQRKLKEHDLTHQALLDTTREELAMRYIQNPRIDLSELAFLLGFAEQSSFQRAFKRWTDCSPGKFRKNLQQT